jgi:cardiolipin synthase
MSWTAHIPNFLTLLRIGAIPVLVFCFFKTSPLAHWVGAALFVIACLTDYLDGYLARVYFRTTRLGAFLDPLADKLLIVSTLFLLAGLRRLGSELLIPALVIVCREMMVSALREFLSTHQRMMLPVSRLAKWKTACQMLAIVLLLIRQDLPEWIQRVGGDLLWIAALLTAWTGWRYFRSTFSRSF